MGIGRVSEYPLQRALTVAEAPAASNTRPSPYSLVLETLESPPCASEERPPSRFGVRGQGGDHPPSSRHWSIGRTTHSHRRIPSRSKVGEPAFTLSDVYARPLCVVVSSSSPNCADTSRHRVRGRSMQDPASEFRRINLLRTRVNRGRREGRGCNAPAPSASSCLARRQLPSL